MACPIQEDSELYFDGGLGAAQVIPEDIILANPLQIASNVEGRTRRFLWKRSGCVLRYSKSTRPSRESLGTGTFGFSTRVEFKLSKNLYTAHIG